MGNFSDVINGLYTQYEGGALRDRTERMQIIDATIERYYEETGQMPSTTELDRLSTLILKEELTDHRKNRMKVNEHPIMSERWEERRHNGETSLNMAEEVGSDRRSYRKPTRSYRRKK